MNNNSFSETRKSQNKSFIVDNSLSLQEYARKNYDFYGAGIVVVNLLLLKTEDIRELDLFDSALEESSELTVHKPLAYIPYDNFWFKMINLKIQKKHKIDLKAKDCADEVFVVFIKDDALEYFSVYTIKSKKAPKSLND